MNVHPVSNKTVKVLDIIFPLITSGELQMSKDLLKQFSELSGKQVEVPALCMYTIKYMLDKGMKLDNTEGMIEASVFPVNYFTIKQVRI